MFIDMVTASEMKVRKLVSELILIAKYQRQFGISCAVMTPNTHLLTFYLFLQSNLLVISLSIAQDDGYVVVSHV